MYKFKTIDYRLSNQEYIFSLLSMQDEDKYDFIYVPYSEFPALLMLDYVLATNPHEFNAELFKYFHEVGKSEKYSRKDILIISKDLADRDSIVNKFGVFIKDAHLSQIQEQIKSGRKQVADGGKILDLTASSGRYREVDILHDILGINEEREIVFSNIYSFLRDNKELANLSNVMYLSNRIDENKGKLLDGKIFEKEILLGSLIYPIEAYRLRYNYGVVHNSMDMVGEDRVSEITELEELKREECIRVVPHKDIPARALNQFEGLLSKLDTYSRDFLRIDVTSAIEGYREYILRGEINYYILAERLSYISTWSDTDYILALRINELGSTIVDFQRDFESFHDAELGIVNLYNRDELYTDVIATCEGVRYCEWGGYLDDLELLFEKKIKGDLIAIKDVGREGVGEGYLSTLTIFDKEEIKDVILENIISSSGETEKIAELNYTSFSETDVEHEVELVYMASSDLLHDRYGAILIHEVATKYVLDEVAMESILYGIKESMGAGTITIIRTSEREKGYDSRLLENFYIGDRFKEHLSILISDVLADKEKDVELEFNSLVDKEKDTLLISDDRYSREFLSLGHLWYDTNYIIERHGEGVLEFVFTSTKELGYDAVIDLMNLCGGHGENRQVYTLRESFISTREVGGKGLSFDLMLSSSDSFREGKCEFLINAVKPRKKLIKSWLDKFERGGKKDLALDFYKKGIKDSTKDLERFYIDIAERYIRKDLEIFDSLEGGEIKRINKLDRDISTKDANIPITKLVDKDTTIVDGLIYRVEPLLKFNLEDYDYEKDGFIDYDTRYSEKFKNAFIEEQVASQGLMYDYSDILKEGMEVEHWEVGYAIPEDYDPLDPFNPYYPWAEERNKHSIVQEEEWEEIQGEWELDKGNAAIIAKEGGGLLTTKQAYGDFKFKFRTQLGYMPDCRTGFIFRYDDINNYYKFTLSSGNNPIDLIQVIDGRERRIASPIAPFFMDGGSWHTVDISLVEDRLVIYVDGRLQYDLVLES